MSLHGASKRPVHACFRCRSRKIRCGREKPECRQCQHHGHRCVYEVDVQTDDDLPHDTKATLVENEQKVLVLQQRVDSLEAVVKRLAAKVDSQSESPTFDSEGLPEPLLKPGHLQEDDGEYRYVGSLAWERLLPRNESSGLSNGLDGGSHKDAFASILFMPLDSTFDSTASIPPMNLITEFWHVFKDRVDPIVRILHKPTFEARLLQYMADGQASLSPITDPPSEPGRETKRHHAFMALLFAILHSAVRSLSSQEVQSLQMASMSTKPVLGSEPTRRVLEKHELMSRFIYACQQNLMKSNAFSRPRQDAIAAFCLLLFTRYNEADRDTSLYVCSGVLTRCARSYGLHMEPTLLEEALSNKNRSVPFTTVEIECRRRLWHQILHLDTMICESAGIEPEPLYNGELWPTESMTKLPSDLSDNILKTSSDVENLQRTMNTSDMSMQLVRFYASLSFRYVASMSRFRITQKLARQKIEEASRATLSKTNELRQRYSENDLNSFYTRTLATLTECKLFLVYYNRFDKGSNQSSWNTTRRRALSAATEMLEVYINTRNHTSAYKYAWHLQRHSQLHVTIHVLDELCRTDPFNVDPETFEVCRKAWNRIKDHPVEEEDVPMKRVWKLTQRLKDQARLRWSTDSADVALMQGSNTSQNQQYFQPVDFAALASNDGLDYFSVFQDLDASFNMDLF